jgi:hypothetical protein
MALRERRVVNGASGGASTGAPTPGTVPGRSRTGSSTVSLDTATENVPLLARS